MALTGEDRPPASPTSDSIQAPREPSTRDQRMVLMRSQGATLADIGEAFGVTRERARQIILGAGGPDNAALKATRSALREEQRAQEKQRVDQALRALIAIRGALTSAEAASELQIPERELSAFWPEDLSHMRIREGHGSPRTWTDTDVLDAIREAAIYEFPLTTGSYAELVRVGQVIGPSLPHVLNRFGSWNSACDAAGVHHGQSMRPGYESRWTDEDLIAYAREYFLDPSWPNSAHRYDEWKRLNAPEGPSQATIRVRFGKWSDVQRRALASTGEGRSV